MPSNSNLLRRLYDANGNVHEMQQAFNDWQISHCYYPIEMPIYDSHYQITRKMLIPCGNCYHCRETKINDWCTRMYAHLEDFKHVYFITLTYRSITNVDLPANRLLLEKLNDAVWHYDALNFNKRYSFNPCLLVKSHYQNFFKRLRKNTGFNDLTYVLSGEYGKKYGRPHFHIILFSNNEITRDQIVRAWSVALWKDNITGNFKFRRNQRKNGAAYDFPIGRVDFHDLVSNGTLNTAIKIQVDGRYLDAANCFAYVCKYVCKSDTVNYNRVKLAYDSLFVKREYVKVFQNEVQWHFIRSYLLDYGYDFDLLDQTINNFKKYRYEKIEFLPNECVFSHGLSQSKTILLFGHQGEIDVYPKLFYDFKRSFKAFCEFSRGTPIGSLYAMRHLQEFKDGVFKKPLLQDSSFVVSRYFLAKAAQNDYGLRQCRQTLASRSYSLGGLTDLYGRFLRSFENGVLPREHFYSNDPSKSIDSALSHDKSHFADLSSGEKVVLCDEQAMHFKYNRHSRQYDFTRSIPLAEWLKYWLNSLQCEFIRHDFRLRITDENTDSFINSKELLEKKRPFELFRDTFITTQKNYLKQKQKDYDQLHLFVE